MEECVVTDVEFISTCIEYVLSGGTVIVAPNLLQRFILELRDAGAVDIQYDDCGLYYEVWCDGKEKQ